MTAPRAEPELLAPARRAPPPPPPPILRAVAPSFHELPEVPASEAAAYCRSLLGERERAGDRDGAYRAAVCLEVLGEADINESLLATTHRPEGLQAVRGALSYTDWNEHLSVGCGEPATTALLRALGPALARVGFQYARRMHREPVLPDEARQDPEKSTATLAKALHWTSRVLAIGAAELYVLPEVAGSLALVPGPERPIISCARSLGSGLSLPELACLWARELAFLRPEESALCYFPNVQELSLVLSAALALGGGLGMRAIDGDAKRLSSQLKREVRGAALDALQAAARAFPVSELDARARAFVISAEIVAGRVALVACGDLELTLALERRFPRPGLTSADERRADLLRFMVSPELGQIRASLGVSLV